MLASTSNKSRNYQLGVSSVNTTGSRNLIAFNTIAGVDAKGFLYAITNTNPKVLVIINSVTWVTTDIYTFGSVSVAGVTDNGTVVFADGAVVYSVGPYTGTYLTTATTLFTAGFTINPIAVDPTFTAIYASGPQFSTLTKFTNWNGSTATTASHITIWGNLFTAVSPTGTAVAGFPSQYAFGFQYGVPGGSGTAMDSSASGVGPFGLFGFDVDGLPVVGKTVSGASCLYKYTSPPSDTSVKLADGAFGSSLTINRFTGTMYVLNGNSLVIYTPKY